MLEIMEILAVARERGIYIYDIKENWELNGSIQSKVMAMVFSIAAEIERDLISRRTKEALRVRKAAGVKLGRPKGPGKSKLDQYREEIIKIVKHNAQAEFSLLWNEHEKKGIPFTLLTNRVSRKINDITDAVFNSDLPANTKLRENIIIEYTPRPLLELIGLENILKRVPENYLNAIVASKVATNFVYKYGMESNEIDFFNYLRNFVS
jgi:hypothetical protein